MSTRITEAMVEALGRLVRLTKFELAGNAVREPWKTALDKADAALAAALSTEPGEADGWPKECATEGCGRAVTIYFQRGGIGSHYCCDCYMRIQAIPAGRSALESDNG